ncbi:MAG: inactive transglutaminase family protein [Planctomycetes bacterium]|nr:inactive transglutaminase family protein [Planctomycetota bacterium]
MNSKIQFYIIIFFLVLVGFGLTCYKAVFFGFPLLPGQHEEIWIVEAKIAFTAKGDPVKASFHIPSVTPDYAIQSEDFASTNYGFSKTKNEYGWRANWYAREMRGIQTLYYRVQFFGSLRFNHALIENGPTLGSVPFFEEPYRTAVNTLIEQVRSHSADTATFTGELLKSLNSPTRSQNVNLLLREHSSIESKTELILKLLTRAEIPARIVRGLFLEDGARNQSLFELIQVYDGSRWVYFNPLTGNRGFPENFFIWQKGGKSLLDIVGGEDSNVTFSITRDLRTAMELATFRANYKEARFIDFSIYSLPIDKQNSLTMLLLVPIGALVVVIMNNLVGLPTSGTFMPILIAMSFKQTELLPGLCMFCIIIGAGLQIRSYLSHLNLLFVPRISAVVIVVILLMSCMSVFSFKLGIRHGLGITFFPMIILAWTIERISIVWEEQGHREALIQCVGSLLVASIAFLVMENSIVEHLTFTFPELILANLAIILLIGNYTGYRLCELRRFKSVIKE